MFVCLCDVCLSILLSDICLCMSCRVFLSVSLDDVKRPTCLVWSLWCGLYVYLLEQNMPNEEQNALSV